MKNTIRKYHEGIAETTHWDKIIPQNRIASKRGFQGFRGDELWVSITRGLVH